MNVAMLQFKAIGSDSRAKQAKWDLNSAQSQLSNVLAHLQTIEGQVLDITVFTRQPARASQARVSCSSGRHCTVLLIAMGAIARMRTLIPSLSVAVLDAAQHRT